MQVLAGIHDALAHQAPEALDFSERLREKGVRGAAEERDARFEKSSICWKTETEEPLWIPTQLTIRGYYLTPPFVSFNKRVH